jgi:anti-sigma factor RsiW
MFTRHVSRQLAAHIAGQLTQPKARQVEHHLRHCARCREESAQVSQGIAALTDLPLAEAPEAIWSSIQSALQDDRTRTPRVIRPRWAIAAIAALALMVLASGAYWRVSRPKGTRWEVVWLKGRGAGRIGAGQWIETDATSRARVEVGAIGSVEVAPSTRVRVVTARPDEHRLQLERGEIRARISAPPKLFFVDTASGTAVDLGCEYTLRDDELGSGLLSVTRGWVSFQWKGAESLVPAGASCRTRPRAGLGIPYFDDAPERLKEAIDAFAFDKGGNDALATILSEARKRTLSRFGI